MAARAWKQGLLTVPGIGVALLPKLACPLCWPAYAAVLSSVGLGFLISTRRLLSVTIAFLVLSVAVLAFRAKQRRGYGPFGFGLIGSAAVLTGKFYLDWNPAIYAGIAVVVLASIWNSWPRRAVESCPCNSEEKEKKYGVETR